MKNALQAPWLKPTLCRLKEKETSILGPCDAFSKSTVFGGQYIEARLALVLQQITISVKDIGGRSARPLKPKSML